MKYPKFIVTLGDSLAKIIVAIRKGLKFYDDNKENKITVGPFAPEDPEYRDVWFDTSKEYVPPIKYFNIHILQTVHQTIQISDGITTYQSDTQLPEKTPVKVIVIPDEGYEPVRTNVTEFILHEDTTIQPIEAPKKIMLKVELKQVPHQRIIATYMGKEYTETFMAEYGSHITFRTESTDKDYFEGDLNITDIPKLTEPIVIENTYPPRVKTFLIRISKYDHQRIYVVYDGEEHYDTFEIPINAVRNYAVFIEADDNWDPGEIRERKDRDKRGTTLSATQAEPHMVIITVEQYQNQNIWVHVEEPGGVTYIEKERFSISVPAGSHIKTEVVPKNSRWTPGVCNIIEDVVEDNITLSAGLAVGSDTVMCNLVFKALDDKEINHIEVLVTNTKDGSITSVKAPTTLSYEEGTLLTLSKKVDDGYDNSTVAFGDIEMTKDNEVVLKPSTPKMYHIKIKQSPGETITAFYKGEPYTSNFDAEFESEVTFTVEAINADDFNPGVLNIDHIDKVNEDVLITVTKVTSKPKS